MQVKFWKKKQNINYNLILAFSINNTPPPPHTSKTKPCIVLVFDCRNYCNKLLLTFPLYFCPSLFLQIEENRVDGKIGLLFVYLYNRETPALQPGPGGGLSFNIYGLSPVTTLSWTKALCPTKLIIKNISSSDNTLDSGQWSEKGEIIYISQWVITLPATRWEHVYINM